MAVTLRDVASRAGVSPVVVSRVLHNKALSIRVSEATAQRVRDAALEMGYRCNVMARSFRSRQTMCLGVLHGSGVTRPKFAHGSRYFAALMDGIVEGAFRYNYSVTLCPKLLGQSSEDAMSDGRFDGLVWYSSVSTDENLEAVATSAVPLVLLHAKSSNFGNRHPSVICDNYQGIGLAVDHLVSLGHKRIAFAMEVHPPIVESLDRLAAFRAHMKRHNLPCEISDVIEVDWELNAVSDYFSKGLRHTGIVAENEGLGAEFLSKARTFGVLIPNQLSVIGFDSTSYCAEVRPTLTCVSQPLSTMGAKASELLVSWIDGKIPEQLEFVFPCGLDVRESTGPVQRGALL